MKAIDRLIVVLSESIRSIVATLIIDSWITPVYEFKLGASGY